MAANNYISGGQVFLHKLRMLTQVLSRTLHVSLLAGLILPIAVYFTELSRLDWQAVLSYRKAVLAVSFDNCINPIKQAISDNSKEHITTIKAVSRQGLYGTKVDPQKVLKSQIFAAANKELVSTLIKMLYLAIASSCAVFILTFLLWSRFGKSLKGDRKIKGGSILTAYEVKKILKANRMASDIVIAGMPLIKDSETKHFLVSGATGSGKTNFIDQLLPQVETKGHAAIVIDQTGEMIAKYYKPERGDIIINPLDKRAHNWDFWKDCLGEGVGDNGCNPALEKFAKILFSFASKQAGYNSDPFWQNSAEVIFVSIAQYLASKERRSITELQAMISRYSLEDLEIRLKKTEAARYLSGNNKITASSILSVLSTSTHPLRYLREDGELFSLRSHFQKIKTGDTKCWIFLSTNPAQREITLPLIACILELAVSFLMDSGIDEKRRLWFVIDELASLGRLPALNSLMTESRKYGACVVAALQSINQLYEKYGQYAGSTIFGQFGSKFFFRSDEPQVAKIIVDMCGTELINKQQKNTSFGANEFRDGVSYTEQEKHKNLVEYNDLASLSIGHCFALLPDPAVRLAKLELPKAKVDIKCQGFVPYQAVGNQTSLTYEDNNQNGNYEESCNNGHRISQRSLNNDVEEKQCIDSALSLPR